MPLFTPEAAAPPPLEMPPLEDIAPPPSIRAMTPMHPMATPYPSPPSHAARPAPAPEYSLAAGGR